MVRSAKDAVKAALAQTKNTPGTCQMVTRMWLDSPSVGDFDGDGDADAIDGWKREPNSAKHTDRNPPAGAPVAFRNANKNGFGHRALSLGGGKIRSTDIKDARYSAGHVGTATIAEIEKTMGLVYLGWSETIGGVAIPGVFVEPTKPNPPKVKTSRGVHIDDAIASLKKSKTKNPERAKLKKQALAALLKMPLIK